MSADPPPTKKPPIPVPDLYVVDFSSLLRSFDNVDEPPAPLDGQSCPPPSGGISDEERTGYGLLLDRAAERGLLDSTEYQHRLEELAAATTVEEMNRIVTELPVLTSPRTSTPPATRPRRPSRPAPSKTTPGGAVAVVPQRRLALWVVMAVLVLVAVASLVIVALSVDRLSRSHNSGLSPTVPAGWVISPHL